MARADIRPIGGRGLRAEQQGSGQLHVIELTLDQELGPPLPLLKSPPLSKGFLTHRTHHLTFTVVDVYKNTPQCYVSDSELVLVWNEWNK